MPKTATFNSTVAQCLKAEVVQAMPKYLHVMKLLAAAVLGAAICSIYMTY